MEQKIKGGYYLKARCIQNSEISVMPPHVREIWDWLLKEANHTNRKVNGKTISRGQVIRTYDDIREGLKWKIGWRKCTYTKWQCEIAMKLLKKATMITTAKTTRGIIITICNYNFYQNPKNYESHSGSHRKATMKPQTTDTINKNDKELKNESSDNSFVLALRKNPAYKHIDIDTELAKMDAWLLTRRGRKKTRQFVVNWLNKIDKPLDTQSKEVKFVNE